MKKRILMIGGAVLLVILLGGAAFVGGRLLNGQGLPGLTSGGPNRHGPDIQPAEELPQTPADVDGVFDHRKDKSFFVGTGEVRILGQRDASGNVTGLSSSHTGLVVEVVVTADTKVYKDTTMQQFNGPPLQGQKIQQVVEPGTVDEIGPNTEVVAWGRKTGDRYIAEVLVYTVPNLTMKK